MTSGPRQLLGYIGRLASGSDPRPTTDANLLKRFFRHRDEDAFTTLVTRHATMVRAVCWRVLRDRQDAEDATQAVFLVLARKAATLRRPNALAAWLHGVARHAALKARRSNERRRRQETRKAQGAASSPPPDPRDELTARELLQVVDEELRRLPEVYRVPIILCCLEGHTQDEAAGFLGWTPGSLKGRLERGRKRLHARLVRRGLALSVALVGLELSQLLAAGGTSAAAADGMKDAAVAFAAGKQAQASVLSANAVDLAKRVLEGMAMVRLKLGLVLFLAAGMAAAGAGAVAHQILPAKQPEAGRVQGLAPLAPEAARAPTGGEQQPAGSNASGGALPRGAVARLGVARFRHEGEANALAFSPDGKVLAGLCRDGLLVWEAATGRELRRLPVVAWGLATRPFDFSPPGKVLAAFDGPDKVALYEVATGRRLRTIPFPLSRSPVRSPSLRYSPDGKYLAVATGGDQVWVLEEESGKVVRELGGHRAGIEGLAFAPDGKTLALTTLRPSLQLWDLTTGTLRRGIKPEPADSFASAVAFSPDGGVVAAGWWDQIVLFEAASGKELARLRAKMESVSGLAFTPDGKTLLSASQDSKVRVWDLVQKQPRLTLDGRRGAGRALALSPDGKTVALGNNASTVPLWDVGTGKELFPQARPDGPVRAAVFAPDGQTLFTGGEYETRLWRTRDWRTSRVFSEPAHSLSVTPDGARLASVSPYTRTLRVRDVTSGALIFEQVLPPPRLPRRAVFAAAGRILISLDQQDPRSNPNELRAHLEEWEMAGGRSLRRLALPGVYPCSLAITSDGALAFVGTGESTVLVCDLRRGAVIRELRGYKHQAEALALSGDGRLLLTGSMDRSVRLWEVDSGEEVLTFQAHPRAVLAVAFSPDGRTVVSADGNDGVPYPVTDPRQIRLWDVTTGAEVGRLDGHPADVSALAFSPDGSRLVSALADSTLFVWDVSFLAGRVRPGENTLDRAALDRAWADLTGPDARKAYRAGWSMTAAPAQAVPFLKGQLQPAAAVDADRIRQWITDLEDKKFLAREAAVRNLNQAGMQAEPALRQALTGGPSPEARRRIDDVLRNLLRAPSAKVLRVLRAEAVLERIGSPEARRLLGGLAQGAPSAQETVAARAAIERLEPAPGKPR